MTSTWETDAGTSSSTRNPNFVRGHPYQLPLGLEEDEEDQLQIEDEEVVMENPHTRHPYQLQLAEDEEVVMENSQTLDEIQIESNYVEDVEEEVVMENPQTLDEVQIESNYVEEVRKRFLIQQSEKKVIRTNQKLGTDILHIRWRLRESAHPVNLPTLTCLQGHCGRSFERIQVLAFHVSYAHQDIMTTHSTNLTCLLCGKKWTSVRRKIMHLSLAHKEIGEEHNNQCIQQVESVIDPNAPKAQRIEKKAMEEVEEDNIHFGLEEEVYADGVQQFLHEQVVDDVPEEFNYLH